MKMLLQTISFVAATLAACAADFNVRDFGAMGDGAAKDTSAIQAAIDTATAKGGGRVVLSGGTFLSGAFRLKSGVELYIDRTASLLASPGQGFVLRHTVGMKFDNTEIETP